MNEKQFDLKARKTLARLQRELPEVAEYLHALDSKFEAPRFIASHKEISAAVSGIARELLEREVRLVSDLRQELIELLEYLGEDTFWLTESPSVKPGPSSPPVSVIAGSTEAAINRFSPRLDPTWREILSSASTAGSWRFAATELVSILVAGRIPVTAGERDELHELLAALSEPTEDIDHLNVGMP